VQAADKADAVFANGTIAKKRNVENETAAEIFVFIFILIFNY
jgi:hypothetical protein